MKEHFIAWWNLENLFDVENEPTRLDWLQKELATYLKGWTAEVLDKKINNLASVIIKLNNQTGPDIMGFCEIENRHVIELLVSKLAPTGRNYDIVHHDMNDHRGIDIAFIYDTAKYTPEPEIFSLEVMKRTGTRDLLQVNFTINAGGRKLFLVGNHWPSRSGGQYESEPFRMMVGENLSYWMKRIGEIRGEEHPVIVVGDFNDEPFNRSITEYALGTPDTHKIENAARPVAPETVHKPYLYNLMYPLLGNNRGTFVFGNEINLLDQFMVSRALLLNDSPFFVAGADIVSFPELVKGEYNTPVKFGAPSQKTEYNPNGFSDHLPVYMIVQEED